MRRTIANETPEKFVEASQERSAKWDVMGEKKGRPRIRKLGEQAVQLVLQMMRFGLVGVVNTALDLLIFNAFLFLFPTKNTMLLLVYNSVAYALGSVNSFLLNKYWTFRHRQRTSFGEVLRFAITTLLGIACNDLIIWLLSDVAHPLIADARLWANVSKICAIFGTVLISFLGLRLWVFVKATHQSKER